MSIRRRTLGPGEFVEQPRCDVCGKPAIWRDRVITLCCVLGEATCDECENKASSWQSGKEDFWGDVAGDMKWLFGKLPFISRK